MRSSNENMLLLKQRIDEINKSGMAVNILVLIEFVPKICIFVPFCDIIIKEIGGAIL